MNKKIIITAFLLAAGLFATRNAQAQRTYEEMEHDCKNQLFFGKHPTKMGEGP